jgi:high-affinity iron transporter
MFQTLLIAFREGLEALLVVAIARLYLRRTERLYSLGAIRTGLATAVVLSLMLGYALSRIGAMSPMDEGVMALLAAAAVVWCVLHMMKAGKTLGREINARLARATLLDGFRAWLAVFGFTLFMVGREGVEIATMLAPLASSAELGYMVGAA